ncbi:MAG: hypothetical protein ACSLE0_11365 [Chitinophagaceae bacterium]
MNYHLTRASNPGFIHFMIRFSLLVLLFFLIVFLVFETFSFIRLFEVTIVANPAINLIK